VDVHFVCIGNGLSRRGQDYRDSDFPRFGGCRLDYHEEAPKDVSALDFEMAAKGLL
jgi:hypothetical protein